MGSFSLGEGNCKPSKLGSVIVIQKKTFVIPEVRFSIGNNLTDPALTFGMNDSSERHRRGKRHMPASRRAKHHLRYHGRDLYGQEYAFFPCTITFNGASKVIIESRRGICDQKKNSILHWITEPLSAAEGDLSYVTTSSICNQMRYTLSNGGILYGIEEDSVLKSCLIFQQVDPSKNIHNGPLKRFTDVLAQWFSFSPLMKPSDTDKKKRNTVGQHVNRCQQLEGLFSQWHTAFSPQTPHWYLSELAVVSDYQGKGLGNEMMSTFVKLANRYRMDVYLECGTDVTEFFAKYGFKELARKRICPSTEEGSITILEISIMLRAPH